jgi:acyl carrier protein
MPLQDFLIQEIKNVSFKTVKPDESVIKSGLLSSITLIDLVVAIEEAYKIKIPFNDISTENFDTVELIIKFLHSRDLKVE